MLHRRQYLIGETEFYFFFVMIRASQRYTPMKLIKIAIILAGRGL